MSINRIIIQTVPSGNHPSGRHPQAPDFEHPIYTEQWPQSQATAVLRSSKQIAVDASPERRRPVHKVPPSQMDQHHFNKPSPTSPLPDAPKLTTTPAVIRALGQKTVQEIQPPIIPPPILMNDRFPVHANWRNPVGRRHKQQSTEPKRKPSQDGINQRNTNRVSKPPPLGLYRASRVGGFYKPRSREDLRVPPLVRLQHNINNPRSQPNSVPKFLVPPRHLPKRVSFNFGSPSQLPRNEYIGKYEREREKTLKLERKLSTASRNLVVKDKTIASLRLKTADLETSLEDARVIQQAISSREEKSRQHCERLLVDKESKMQRLKGELQNALSADAEKQLSSRTPETQSASADNANLPSLIPGEDGGGRTSAASQVGQALPGPALPELLLPSEPHHELGAVIAHNRPLHELETSSSQGVAASALELGDGLSYDGPIFADNERPSHENLHAMFGYSGEVSDESGKTEMLEVYPIFGGSRHQLLVFLASIADLSNHWAPGQDREDTNIDDTEDPWVEPGSYFSDGSSDESGEGSDDIYQSPPLPSLPPLDFEGTSMASFEFSFSDFEVETNAGSP